jgi:CRP-like cAMP-binding protein
MFSRKVGSKCFVVKRRLQFSMSQARWSVKCPSCSAPHTATARVLGDAKVYVIEDGRTFLRAHPDLSWLVARLLANRLNATTYLVDLKRQFAGHGDHLEMVGEVLDALIHQQERDFQPGSDRDPRRA